MEIESKRLILRNWKDEDVNDLVQGLNNIEVAKWMAGVPSPYTEKDAKNFIEQAKRQDEKIKISLAIVLKENNKVIGGTEIRNINKKDGTAGGGIWLNEKYQKNGYGIEAFSAKIKFCFKELGIDNVLMDCDKSNIGSAKSIQNNGGILENEIYVDNELVQRYWISLKKRFVTNPMNMKCVIDGNYIIKNFETDAFKGDIALIKFNKMNKPYMVENINLCMANDNYKWLEFYDYSKKYRLTAMYNDKNEIVEWYFDIARKIGKKNGLPYEDDLYLDVVVTSSGETILLDEDELKSAYDRVEVTKKDYDMAYNEANQLMEKLKSNKDKLEQFTNNYLKIMSGDDI